MVDPTKPQPDLDRVLLKTRGWTFAVRVVVWTAAIAFSFLLFLTATPIEFTFGILLCGLFMAHGVELQHQCLHQTAFRRKLSNDLLGKVLGMPMLVDFEQYRQQHLWHHQSLGTPHDAEFFQDRPHAPFKSNLEILKFLFSSRRLVATALSIFGLAKVEDNIDKKAKKDGLGPIYLFLFCLGFLCISTHSLLPMAGWLTSLFLIAEPVHKLIEMPEHFGCNNASRSTFENTRTIRGSWLTTWFTNGNNFHVEHHKFPKVPMQNMLLLHKHLRPFQKNYTISYFDFFRSIFFRSTPVLTKTPSKTDSS